MRDWAAARWRRRSTTSTASTASSASFLKGMADLHLLGICIPEEYGGAGMDYISLGLVCEELEYVDTHLRVIMSVHVGLNCMTLWCWGTEEQKKKYLVPQAQGEKIATYGLTEPNAGSDAVGIQTHRRAQGRPLRPERREGLDQPGRRGRPLPGHRLDRPGEEEEPRPQRPQRLHRGARLQGLQLLHHQGEVGHPGRQHRRLLHGRRRGAGREPGGRGGRGLQGRHVRPRERPLHGGGRAPPA